MKVRKIAIIGAIVICAAFFMTTHAVAADVWQNATVNFIGVVEAGSTAINLTASNNSFVDQWFTIPAGNENEVLAIGLTAASLPQQVLVKADPVTGELKNIYLAQ